MTDIEVRRAINDFYPHPDFEKHDRERHELLWNSDLEPGEEPTPYEPDESKNLLQRMHKRQREAFVDSMILQFGLDFDETKFSVETVIPVMWMGWECDQFAYLVKYDGKPYVLGTDHGSFDKMTEEALLAKINEYRQAIEQTAKAISFLRTA